MDKTQKPIANPSVVLREESDDWALLFNPDKDSVLTVDPVAVYIWKHLDGKNTIGDIMEDLRKDCEGVPDDAEKYVIDLIQDLEKRQLVGYEVKE